MRFNRDRDYIHCPFFCDERGGIRDTRDTQLEREINACLLNARAGQDQWLADADEFARQYLGRNSRNEDWPAGGRLFIWGHGNARRDAIADGLGNQLSPVQLARHLDELMGLSKNMGSIIVWTCYSGVQGGFAQFFQAALAVRGYARTRVGGFRWMTGSVQAEGRMDMVGSPTANRPREALDLARPLNAAPEMAARGDVADSDIVWYPNKAFEV